MGLYLLPYGVKMNKVQDTFNSNDTQLFEAIKETNIFDNYQSQDKNYDVNLETALKQIIFGEDKNKNFPPAYGYALMSIVAYFGENLAQEGDVFKFGSVNEAIENKLKEYNVNFEIQELIQPIYTFDIPPNPSDFPIIGGITKSELQNLQSQLKTIEISENQINWRSDEFDEELEAIYILQRGVNYCLENNLEWISFAH